MAADLRAVLRIAAGREHVVPTAVVLDSRTLQSTPESGGRAGDDGYKRRNGTKTHIAVDTLGHLPALRVTPADVQDRAQAGALAKAVQAVTGKRVALAYVHQGYTGEQPAAAAARHGVTLARGQAALRQARLRAPAAPLGRRAQLRLGRTLPSPRPRL